MNRKQTRAYRFETLHHNRDSALSLLPLDRTLAKAQKDLPPRVSSSQRRDAREDLPVQLIARIKGQFKSSIPAHWIGSPVQPGWKERAGNNA